MVVKHKEKEYNLTFHKGQYNFFWRLGGCDNPLNSDYIGEKLSEKIRKDYAEKVERDKQLVIENIEKVKKEWS